MAKKITSKNVAEIAGVSQSAVSRTFTPGASVSPKTREKVLKVANCLGYRPNAIARSLSTQRTYLVGLVVPRMQEPFYAEVLHRFTIQLQKRRYATFLLNAFDGGSVDSVVSTAQRYQVEGLICASVTISSSFAEHCAQYGLPLVMFHRFPEQSEKTNIVRCDHFAGGRLLAEALVDAGHRRIAFLGGAESSSTSREREKGFIDGLAGRGVQLWDREQVATYEYGDGYQIARGMLQRENRPDAIFAFNDIMAMATIDCARDLGIAVPDALSVVGFDGIAEGQWAAYRLTTIRQPIEDMVNASVDMLLNAVASPDAGFAARVFPGEFIRGGSARLVCP